jgi:hypothetical protein
MHPPMRVPRPKGRTGNQIKHVVNLHMNIPHSPRVPNNLMMHYNWILKMDLFGLKIITSRKIRFVDLHIYIFTNQIPIN